jgi:serine/threonine protein kinase/WD40 repeat protein
MAEPSLQRVEELFHQAVTLGSEERHAFLDGACGGDYELRAAVEELIRHDAGNGNTHSFLESPVAGVAGACRSDAATRLEPPTGDTTEHGGRPSISGYEVVAELGRGGMGVVYLVRQTSLNRLVALKMLLPSTPASPDQLNRFRAEAEALARLNHPNIVPVYDIGASEGHPYFTMEYVRGPSLARVLNQRPQDAGASARLIEILARTIHAVHECGIVHRDLKPANVLLQRVGAGGREKEPENQPVDLAQLRAPASLIPKVTDFGLAKDLNVDRKLTRSGTAMGTPMYMAPEQVRNLKGGVGRGADIYALGSILYEMLTGRLPFDAENLVDTFDQLLHDEPLSPARLRPSLPRDLVTICLKCLEKSPRRRYASAWDLAEDLRRFQAGEPIQARPVGLLGRVSRWCRRRPLVASLIALSAGLTLALLVTAVVYSVLLKDALAKAEAKDEEERQQIVQLNVGVGIHLLEGGDNLTALLRFAEALRLDEGVPEREVNHRTRIATTLRQSPRLVGLWTPAEPVLCLEVGASGGWLATASADHRVAVWDLCTGQPFGPAWQQDDEPILGAFSPDGQFLATVGKTGTARVRDWRAGTVREFSVQRDQMVRRVDFADGRRRLLVQYTDSAVHLWDLTARQPVLLWQLPGSEVAHAVVSDGGRWLLTLDAGRGGQVRNLATGEADGKPVKRDQATTQAAISVDGRRVALLAADTSLRVWDVEAAGWLGTPLHPANSVSRVVFSPDAEQVILVGHRGTIQVGQARSGTLTAFASGFGGPVTQVQFSADGRWVVTGNGVGEVCVWDVETGQAETPPLRHFGPVTLAAFAAGGKQVVVVGRGSTVRVWELPTISDGSGHKSGPGPDVKEAMVEGGPRVVKLQDGATVQMDRPVSAGRLRPPLPGKRRVEDAVFSADGRRVVVCGEDAAARVWDTVTGEPLTSPLRHKGPVVRAAFSPHGDRLLTADESQTARVWDPASGELLAPPLRLPRALQHASFSPDGNRATVVGEGFRHSWDLTPTPRPVAELIALAQVLSGSRIDDKQNRQALDANDLRSAWETLQAAPE